MPTTVLTVQGMTCGHCVASVTEELEAVAGVTSVDVDLPSGRVEVGSDTELADADVRAAVEAAGYTVA